MSRPVVASLPVLAMVTVRAYEELGESNHEACRAVAAIWEHRLGSSRRGRPRATLRPREFLDTVQTVRSLANDFRSRNPFAAPPPQRDLLYETWLGLFWFWYGWVARTLLTALLEGRSGHSFAETLQAQSHTERIYRALARISNSSLETILDSAVRHYRWPEDAAAKLSAANIERFVSEFLRADSLAASRFQTGG